MARGKRARIRRVISLYVRNRSAGTRWYRRERACVCVLMRVELTNAFSLCSVPTRPHRSVASYDMTEAERHIYCAFYRGAFSSPSSERLHAYVCVCTCTCVTHKNIGLGKTRDVLHKDVKRYL